MSSDIYPTLISGLAGLLSGIVVAVSNHWLTRRKTEAEIEKLKAEAELTRAQAKQITESFGNLSDKVSYRLPDSIHASEAIIYTSENSDPFDFRTYKADGAEGDLTIKDGTLYINRTNTAGTFQIWLENYHYGGKEWKILPRNDNISGDRKLRVACEVKAVGGEHTLLFVIKAENAPLGQRMAEKRQRVTSNEWVAVDIYFRVSPGENCHFRIDDRSVSAPNSSIQIRKLVLAERLTDA